MNNNCTVKDNAKQQLAALATTIVSGICANPCFTVHWKTKEEIVGYALDMAETLIDKANARIDVIFKKEEVLAKKESQLEHNHPYGEYTLFKDKNGWNLRNGDIFIYTKYTNFDEIPSDLISNYEEKYKETVCLHPVFWSDDLKGWASDVYNDEEYISGYEEKYIVRVTDIFAHPELYNH